MTNETTDELELWQRSAVRLAVILACALPKDAVDFLNLQHRVREEFFGLEDYGHAVMDLGDPRMKALMGDVLHAMLADLPESVVARADVNP